MHFRPAHPFALTLLAASLPGLATPASAAIDTLVITAARLPQSPDEVIGDLTVLRRAELDAFRGQTLAEVLPLQAGVQFTSNGGPGKASSVFLRGTNAGHAIVLIDGVRFGSATLGSAALQHLPVDQIERVEILRGAAASLYGSDAIGGVIQIFTRRGKQGGHAAVTVAAGSQGTRNLSANLDGQAGATRYALGLAHSETDGVSSIAEPSSPDYYPDRDGYVNDNLSLALSRRLNARHEIGANLLYAKVESQYDSYALDASWNSVAQSYDYRDAGEQASGALWTRSQFNDAWLAQFKAGTSIDRSDTYTPVSATDLSDLKSSINTRQQEFSWQNEIQAGPGTATVSLETLEQKVSGDTAYAVKRRRINSLLGGYLAQFNALRLQGNLRHDDNSQFGSHNSAQLGASWQLSPAWQLGANLGSGFHAPSFNDLYWPGSESPDLLPEESFNREVFARYHAAALHGGLTVYRNTVRNLIAWAPAPTATDPWRWAPANIGRAALTGATLELAWETKQWSAGGHLDWLDAEDASGSSNDGKQLARRARQAGTVYGGLKWGSVQAKLEVQAQGKRYDDPANRQKLAGYALTNLAASWQFARDWQLAARLNNVFDKDYVQVKDYGTLGRNGLLSLSWQPR